MPAQSSPRPRREQQKRERDRRDRRPTPAVSNTLTGPPDAPVGESTPFETLLRIIRVHKIWVLQGLIIVPVVVMAFTLTQGKEYTATANLLFRDDTTISTTNNTGSISDPTRVAATNDALIALPTVAGRAARIAGDDITAGDVRTAINIGSGQESDVVEIDARPRALGGHRQRVRRGVHRLPQGDRPEAAAGRDRPGLAADRGAAAQRARLRAG
jgi:hypothetical protein